MENYEDPESSLPYIDDSLTDDEINANQYNLKIIENYQNKNRNIEIRNQFPEDVMSKSLSPVAPLAEEIELSDHRLSESEEETCKHFRKSFPKHTGMKLVIKGWNSTVSIKGLDKKSSITFKRKNEKTQEEKIVSNEPRKDKLRGNHTCGESMENSKNVEKPKRGRWKMLTRSLISKSTRFDRRGLDERYPKYVLLKNEEELINEKESYPKIVAFNEKKTESKKQKENLEIKSDFNFKKSFKNKTKPIVSMEEIFKKNETVEPKVKKEFIQKKKKLLNQRSLSENRNLVIKEKPIFGKRKSVSAEKISNSTGNESEMIFNVAGLRPPQGQVFNDIQGIFEDTLRLYSDIKPFNSVSNQIEQQPQQQFEECYSSVPPQYCQFSCQNPCCYPPPPNQPPIYVPVYSHYTKPMHLYKHSDTQTNEEELAPKQIFENSLKQEKVEKEVDFQELPFGILSSFFPRVVIMKTYQNENTINDQEINEIIKERDQQNLQTSKSENQNCDERRQDSINAAKTLEVPQQNLAIKSKMIPEEIKLDTPTYFKEDLYINCLAPNEISSSDEEHKTKTDDSETTEYLQYYENDVSGNESVKPTVTWETCLKNADTDTTEKYDNKGDESISRNLSLTKIGYKMYDNLTKLSLKRENETKQNSKTNGRGINGNGTKKSPYNITLESNNRVVKVTVPENELNLEILNSEGTDIQIGVSSNEAKSTKREEEQKKIVKKNELWHPDNGKKELMVATQRENLEEDNVMNAGPQKIKLSLADNKEVVLSIDMNTKEKRYEKIKEKSTKEIKVGTDDFDLAGGVVPCSLGENYKNLSPRTGQLLKSLQAKLELGEKERRFLTEKINEKLIDEKFQGGIIPGLFLVKQISPRPNITKKPLPVNVPSFNKPKKIVDKKNPVRQLREYYCEECLATMRIFEDENPSVKSMVDKFETIIQLESY